MKRYWHGDRNAWRKPCLIGTLSTTNLSGFAWRKEGNERVSYQEEVHPLLGHGSSKRVLLNCVSLSSSNWPPLHFNKCVRSVLTQKLLQRWVLCPAGFFRQHNLGAILWVVVGCNFDAECPTFLPKCVLED